MTPTNQLIELIKKGHQLIQQGDTGKLHDVLFDMLALLVADNTPTIRRGRPPLTEEQRQRNALDRLERKRAEEEAQRVAAELEAARQAAAKADKLAQRRARKNERARERRLQKRLKKTAKSAGKETAPSLTQTA